MFKLTGDGTLTPLHSFTGQSDGAYPYTALVQGTDGNWYGASKDLYSLNGHIFKMTPTGAVTNLYSFTGSGDGDSPVGGLVQGADGNFYGMTGGGRDYGSVFKITAEGALTRLYAFTDATNGITPAGALVQGIDGNFYGVTKLGALFGSQTDGTIFRITPGGTLNTLHRFKYTDGAHPSAGLIEGSDGNFYGTTYGNLFGGIDPGPTPGNGTVFRMTPEGVLTTLVAFDGFNAGAHPESALVEGADGSLYGTTTDGGLGGRGTVFRISFISAPDITSHPANQTAPAGANVTFGVAVFGAPPLFYQWRKDGTNLSDGNNVFGSSARILRLSNVNSASIGTYSVIVSNAFGSVVSAAAVLKVVTPPMFQSVGQSNGTLTSAWSATEEDKYQLQCNSDLGSTNWINLGSILIATNSAVTASEIVGSEPQRFYRVVLLP